MTIVSKVAKVPDRTASNAFGALLRRYRRAAGLTQEALAERAGYSAVYVGMLERGQRLPHLATVEQLVDALALTGRERDVLQAAARQDRSGDDQMPRLVGRAAELDQLERHLMGEGPPLLLLAGEPGIGKTSLLREVGRRAGGRGWSVVSGGCRRHDHEPYAPLPEALAAHLQDQTPGQTRRDLHGCAWLVRLLPEVADLGIDPLPAREVPPGQERRLIFGAVARYVANIAGPAGTLLLLDDLHWAGADALDLLTTLLRDAAGVPLRATGAYRETELQPRDPLATALADLAHAGLTTRLMLRGLSPDETGQLLDRLVTVWPDSRDDLRARVVRQADGVPFYVVSWAHGLSAHGDGAMVAQVPWDVAQSVRQRVATLAEAVRGTLQAAAVIGRVVPPTLLVRVCAWPEAETIAALATLRAAGMLGERDGNYHFAHDVIRDVVESDAGSAQRIALHRRIGDALERAAGELPVEALAYHYEAGHAPEQAVLYLDRAGDRAAGRAAFATAEGHYRKLIDGLDMLGRREDAARAREKLGAMLMLAGRYDAALAMLERTVAAFRDLGDGDGMARAMARIGYIHGWRGTADQGIERVRPLLNLLDAEGATPGTAMLHMALAQLCFHSGRATESLAAVERAAQVARTFDDARTTALAEMAHGHILHMVGRVDEAIPSIEEGVRLAEALGDRGILAGALDSLISVERAAGAFASASRLNQRALTLAEQAGNPLQVVLMLSVRGWLLFLTGDWSAARADLERAAALQREIDAAWLCPWQLGRLCLAEGDIAAACDHFDACLATAERGGDIHALRLVHQSLAEIDLAGGRPAEAAVRLTPLFDRPGLEEWQVTEMLPTLVCAQMELGELERAASTAADAMRRARRQRNRLALVEALRVAGLVATRQRRWQHAAAALTEAVALAREIGYPYGEARVLHTAGLFATARGEEKAAREHLTAALAICVRLGAYGDAERIEDSPMQLASS